MTIIDWISYHLRTVFKPKGYQPPKRKGLNERSWLSTVLEWIAFIVIVTLVFGGVVPIVGSYW